MTHDFERGDEIEFSMNSNNMAQDEESGKPSLVPAFLTKTFEILEDPVNFDMICWNEAGDSIIIRKADEFSSKVLPKYFKHNNFASFVRQLNMYGFFKTRVDPNWREFRHPLFLRDQKHLLAHIKRKVNHGNEAMATANETSKLLDDLVELRTKHNTVEGRLKQMQSNNEALVQTTMQLGSQNAMLLQELDRMKHVQSVMEASMQKILYFLYELYGSSRRSIDGSRPKKRAKIQDSSIPLLTNDTAFDNIHTLNERNAATQNHTEPENSENGDTTSSKLVEETRSVSSDSSAEVPYHLFSSWKDSLALPQDDQGIARKYNPNNPFAPTQDQAQAWKRRQVQQKSDPNHSLADTAEQSTANENGKSQPVESNGSTQDIQDVLQSLGQNQKDAITRINSLDSAIHDNRSIAFEDLLRSMPWNSNSSPEESKESLAAVPEEDDENQFLSMLLAGDDTFIDLDGVEHGTATLADAWNADP